MKENKPRIPGKAAALAALCWLVYICTYLGRLNYSASLAEMIRTEGFTKAQAGGIGTGFFFTYGFGQMLSGFLGDKLPPRWLVFGGLLLSGLVNMGMWSVKVPETMMILWGINGLAQAFIWSPMIKEVADYLVESIRSRVCVLLNTAVPIGTMAAYGMTAAVISLGSWRQVFLIAAVILVAVSFVWLIGTDRLTRGMESVEREILPVSGGKKCLDCMNLAGSGLGLIMIALLVQGALKDGVTTWIPVYIGDNYGVGNSLAVLGTMVIPLSNLAGVWLAAVADAKWGRGEVKTAGLFFLIGSAALLVLWVSSGSSLILALAMLAVGTTAMMAVNTMLIAVLPARFSRQGKVSTISGLLNSTVYIGSALSTYGIGAVSGLVGWQPTILLWFGSAAAAAVCCFAAVRTWQEYCRKI